jgi:hypothetical protein
MRIFDRESLTPPLLREGLSFDTRRALTGLSDVRSSMEGLLSQHGEQTARGPVGPAQHSGHNIISFVLAVDKNGLTHPTPQDIVVRDRHLAYGGATDVISFSDGGKGVLTLHIKNLGNLPYPVINKAYEANIIGTQTLLKNVPPGPFGWFMWSKFKPTTGPLPPAP